MSLDIGYTPKIFVNTVAKNYLNFDGRMSRLDYWHFVLFYIIVFILLGILLGFLGRIGYMIYNIASLALIIPSIAAAVRRVHDAGKPWWAAIIPFYNLWICIQPGETSSNAYGDVPAVKSAN